MTHVLEDTSMKYVIVSYDQLSSGDFSRLHDLHQYGFRLTHPKDFNQSPKRAPAIKNLPTTADASLLSEADDIDRYMRSLIN